MISKENFCKYAKKIRAYTKQTNEIARILNLDETPILDDIIYEWVNTLLDSVNPNVSDEMYARFLCDIIFPDFNFEEFYDDLKKEE